MQGIASQEDPEARRLAANAKNRAYRLANPERVKAWHAKYRATHPDRFRKSQRDYKRKRYHSDEHYRLQMQLRSRLSKAIGRGCEASAAIAHCGCTIGELRDRLTAQFEPGMSWDNRSDWHIDHIYPLSAIDRSSRAHVLAACNWRNLRPVWAIQNWKKNDAVSQEATELFAKILLLITPEGQCDAAEV